MWNSDLDTRSEIHDHRLHLKIIDSDFFIRIICKLAQELVGKVCKSVSLVIYYNSRVFKLHSRRQRRGTGSSGVSWRLRFGDRGRKFLNAGGADDRLFSRAGAKSAVRGQKFTMDNEAASRFAGEGKEEDSGTSPSSIARENY